jgi:hypothetical protein
MATADVQATVDALRWHHTIDLGNGVVTKGVDDTPAKLKRIGLPADLSRKSVLDIGCRHTPSAVRSTSSCFLVCYITCAIRCSRSSASRASPTTC